MSFATQDPGARIGAVLAAQDMTKNLARLNEFKRELLGLLERNFQYFGRFFA